MIWAKYDPAGAGYLNDTHVALILQCTPEEVNSMCQHNDISGIPMINLMNGDPVDPPRFYIHQSELNRFIEEKRRKDGYIPLCIVLIVTLQSNKLEEANKEFAEFAMHAQKIEETEDKVCYKFLSFNTYGWIEYWCFLAQERGLISGYTLKSRREEEQNQ